MLPAKAGVILISFTVSVIEFGAPREGGGDPIGVTMTQQMLEVLPAKAGVIPDKTTHDTRDTGAPREGGGDPLSGIPANDSELCSPRRRG